MARAMDNTFSDMFSFCTDFFLNKGLIFTKKQVELIQPPIYNSRFRNLRNKLINLTRENKRFILFRI